MNVFKMMSKDYRSEHRLSNEISELVSKHLTFPIWKQIGTVTLNLKGEKVLVRFRKSLQKRRALVYVLQNEQWVLLSTTNVDNIPGAPASFTKPVTKIENKEQARRFVT